MSDRPASDIRVMKFGGSSLADGTCLRRAAARVAAARTTGTQLAVVVSARGDTTDRLLGLAADISARPGTREVDQLLATGETESAALFALALQELGIPATSLMAHQAVIRAAGQHSRGTIAAITPDRINRLLAQGAVPVLAGFQGVDEGHDLITLGRGGSDTTAVALAASLRAERCEIYTDVDGIYSADPRVVPGARRLPAVEVDVMVEMAYAGATVMHSRAVELAASHSVDVHVISSFKEHQGTVITTTSKGVEESVLEEQSVVVAVAHDLNSVQVRVTTHDGSHRLTEQILTALADQGLTLDLLTRSDPSGSAVSFTTAATDVGGGHTVSSADSARAA
ncbi:aspartate kinase [Streptomyces sp. NPDC090442]|uniref:aspartate kinase n=1 Tax=Streptomyces sp. NPDC090442 TaxID=3365962 RepID=UPI00381DC4C1